MRRVCCACGIEYGVKPPEDDRVTHGLCRRCLPAELKRIRKELSALKTVLAEVEQENKHSVVAI